MIRLPAPGHRVVVRYLLPTGQATDALGDLVRVTADEVVVETRRGTVHIVGDTIIAAKEVPPARAGSGVVNG
ncbi:putative acetyltransferase [Demequina rhizosphaerae]|uniref:putative acetyltransferase n=1 Tax=Demequina rhizosphaerae TaxID=1638985 RepID=UPI000782FB63|nr:hypothetical protein [Demequina rhizosphaerae]